MTVEMQVGILIQGQSIDCCVCTKSKCRREGSVLCHSAAWSPDGQKIAFASRNGIYLTSDDGASIHELQTFASVPMSLGWFADGRRIRFTLLDSKRQVDSFWDLTFSDPSAQ